MLDICCNLHVWTLYVVQLLTWGPANEEHCCGNILYCYWKCFLDVQMLMSWKQILCFLAAHILSHCCFWVMFAHAPVWFPQTYKFKIIFLFYFGWHLILQSYTLHAYELEHSGVSPKFCDWYSSVTVFKSNWAPWWGPFQFVC